MIGGKSKEVRPTPILLQSGDVVIMSGEARLAYHGVPRVLGPCSSEGGGVPVSLSAETIAHVWFSSGGSEREADEGTETGGGAVVAGGVASGCGSSSNSSSSCDCPRCEELRVSWPDFVSYLSLSRININVRQVISESCKF